MISDGKMFSVQEIRFAITRMKENKATDKSGVIVEYLKALEEEYIWKPRRLMNGILNGADIPQ